MITNLPVSSDSISILTRGYVNEPWVQSALALLLLGIFAWAANWIAKRIVLRLLLRLLNHLPFRIEAQHIGAIVARLSNIVPALAIAAGIGAVPHLPEGASAFVRSLCTAFIILTIAIAVSGGLALLNDLYQRRPNAANRPIKGYVQLGKLLVYGAAAILIIAALMNQSPLLLLSGLGAMAAVLMLVFKDTILSLVASVQIGSNDMVRVGDWIEMPQLSANGDVIDIALHTVKIQNFDKTITTVPTHRLISESFRNWRGMSESGGRRIMRSVMIDQNSVRFLDEDDVKKMARFLVLRPYLETKRQEIDRWNREHGADDLVNGRRLTNVGTFRAYVLAYLQSRRDIAQDKTLLVRQLAPSENGLPLEIYAFATSTVWAEYEGIQADIFDHLIAILPDFGLQLFQRPTGADLSMLAVLPEPSTKAA
ncbi:MULTISPECIES: mechanosensitive ion channel family protein [Sphingobium]|uniref:Mechanosensing system component YbdG n=2 Tax=Sphingobium TaxID=165695 RepID=T0I0G4_9SPHN|nr:MULTISPECIES: mechanosensitive ion channel domain-containing protein [Sphingobium]AMK26196.1 mechanosensitive ion channel MscS [Sphingobium sp. TKS]EQB05130.1 mechanosensitive ion channel protein MscS [Sphingobium baderi LL03]KKW89521.1 mechanosensitive ion channel protein MscS [Sphingobium chungbukense]KMS58937.1 mechanosensitive ion channel protein MscS [Sphingobium baderi LL03]WRD78672.1 mechanosensitive ion channel [Sphingobium baderi]